MTEKGCWEEFIEEGMLWWTNRILHTFGWSICLNVDEDGEILSADVMRTSWLGFPRHIDIEELEKFKTVVRKIDAK